jgi:hypothetical protein
LHGAVGVEQFAADEPGSRKCHQRGVQSIDGAVEHFSVRVQEQHAVTGGRLKRAVVRSREAQVGRALDESNLRVALPQHLLAPIERPGIDHDNLVLAHPRLRHNRPDTLLEVRLRLPVDDDD